MIKIRGLSYCYHDGTVALSGIDLDITSKESVGIIGPNGAGKTTLLLHLNGILKGSGEVVIDGLKVEEKNLAKIRSRVGLVFQDPDSQLFMPTVFEDVAFGPLNMGLAQDKIASCVDRALGEVDMLYARERMAHHLSFGEKKRVSIATVLSMEPKILALDEPTSNLDPKHRRSLIKLVQKLELTKIIATHDLNLVLEVCSRVIILDGGRIAADGPAREILSNKQLLESHSLELP
jgi:cobalt/nickel transport system ATP-binding protein